MERGVKWFKNSFLAQRRFVDDADLQAQATVWLEEVNTRRASDATKEIPANRLERERLLLVGRRLPFTPAEYALRQPVTVLPTGMVHVFGTSYSVNPKKVGAPAVAFMRANTVEIVIDGVRCTHPRMDYSDDPQRLPEHNQAMLAVVHGERKRNTFKRQCLWELGDGARNFLERLIHRLGAHGNWAMPVHRLYALLEEHGAGAMATALGRCHDQCAYQISDVVRALRPQVVAP